MDLVLDSPPPESVQHKASINEKLKNKIQNSVFWASCLRHVSSLGQKDMV